MNKIREALELLDGGNRWIKSMGTDDKTCIMGALGMVGGSCNVGDVDVIRRVIEEQHPGRGRYGYNDEGTSVALFNDHPDTIWTDVERVMEKAAMKLDEEVR